MGRECSLARSKGVDLSRSSRSRLTVDGEPVRERDDSLLPAARATSAFGFGERELTGAQGRDLLRHLRWRAADVPNIQPLVVVGGGDCACEEAAYLTRFASVVYLVHRRDTLRASKIMAERTLAHTKIKPVWDSAVTEVLDVQQDKVTGVRLKNVETGKESTQAVSSQGAVDVGDGLADFDCS